LITSTTNKPTTIQKMADRDLSEDEVADLKEAFAMFDINGDGMSLESGSDSFQMSVLLHMTAAATPGQETRRAWGLAGSPYIFKENPQFKTSIWMLNAGDRRNSPGTVS
jgi:hypothetical protein